jgi:hypothetical protein
MIITLLVLVSAIANPERFAFLATASRLVCATGLGMSLSAALLVAFFAFLGHFPRDLYPLPGVARLFDVAQLLARSLFWKPPHDAGNLLLLNTPWLMGRHEFEYGVTCIPLGILVLGGVSAIHRRRQGVPRRSPNATRWLCAGLVCGLLTVPIAFNYYTPAWNAFLKRLPLIKSSSQNIRLFSIYIPIVILLASITIERAALLRKHRRAAVLLCVAAMLAINVLADRDTYHTEHYDPKAILEAYSRVQSGQWVPMISHIAASIDESGRPVMTLDRNDSLARGHSQLMCDEPMFGYRLELFPRKSLHPGPTLEARDGVFNIKNPACYLFPEENHCSPGDHFTLGQEDEASAFVHFRPFAFKMSAAQQAANILSVTSLLAVLLFLLWYGGRSLADKLDSPPA